MANAVGRQKKRAIALGGGGPAAGFLIGALRGLEKCGITFDVWSLSCIGAWVGTYYNQLSGESKASQTLEFFREHAFRDTASYRGFPVNRAFAPNFQDHALAWMEHLSKPWTYWSAFDVSKELPGAGAGWGRFLTTPKMWVSQGDVNAHVLNNILAVHPVSRFLTSAAFLAEINGLSNIYYKDSSFLDSIDLGKLDLVSDKGLEQMSCKQLQELAVNFDRNSILDEREKVPEIYHNAWRLQDPGQVDPEGKIQLFNNKWLDYRRSKTNRREYLPITRASLCACSALPYIEQTVKIPNDDGRDYSEGALVDTVSFRDLVRDHPDLDEVWICRIVDYRQVRKPENLHDSLGNLCEQFAAEVGENDVELFKTHLRKCAGRTPRIVEILLRLDTGINFRWDRANLDRGYAEGLKSVETLIGQQADLVQPKTNAPEW